MARRSLTTFSVPPKSSTLPLINRPAQTPYRETTWLQHPLPEIRLSNTTSATTNRKNTNWFLDFQIKLADVNGWYITHPLPKIVVKFLELQIMKKLKNQISGSPASLVRGKPIWPFRLWNKIHRVRLKGELFWKTWYLFACTCHADVLLVKRNRTIKLQQSSLHFPAKCSNADQSRDCKSVQEIRRKPKIKRIFTEFFLLIYLCSYLIIYFYLRSSREGVFESTIRCLVILKLPTFVVGFPTFSFGPASGLVPGLSVTCYFVFIPALGNTN